MQYSIDAQCIAWSVLMCGANNEHSGDTSVKHFYKYSNPVDNKNAGIEIRKEHELSQDE